LIGLPLLGTIVAPYWFFTHPVGWRDIPVLAVTFIVSYVAIGLGVTLGFHRLFTHQSFSTKRWIAFILAALGTMAFQGSLLRWIADHRRHHAHADECGDGHSPYIDASCANASTLRGFVHAHVSWMFDDSATDYEVYAKDLLKDPLVMFFHRTLYIWLFVSLFVPWFIGFAIGGSQLAWGCLLLAGCVRTTMLHNVTWAVNSVCHTFGYESYPQKNKSKNNYFIAMMSFGEGWHNNHHRFPRSAFHGLSPSELDISGHIISFLERRGLVQDVVRIPPEKLS
jgi:stearoyl-CoA desaturase (delta-9 desaturase)